MPDYQDITLFVTRELKSQASVTTLIGSSPEWSTWIWRWSPRVSIEGTGRIPLWAGQADRAAGIVVARRTGWSTPNLHNTAEFPQVQIEVYADPLRNPDGNPTKDDAEQRALGVCGAVRKVMHRPQGGEFEWGSAAGKIRVVSSVQQSEPDVADVPGGDGLVRALMQFAVVLG